MNSLVKTVQNTPLLAAAACLLVVAGLLKASTLLQLKPQNTDLNQTIDQRQRVQRLDSQQAIAKSRRSGSQLDSLPAQADILKFQTEQDRLAKLFNINIIQIESVSRKSENRISSATDFDTSIQGSYVGLRGWVTALLNSHPNLALRSLSIKRVGDDIAPLRGQAQFTWYAKAQNQ